MLKILGRKTSSNVQKVLWVADELGLEYERSDIGGPFGGNDTPDYLKRNPNGKVPTIIEDDGWVLWESNAITRYLAAKHGNGTLYPTDLRVRADAERWMDWQTNTVSPQMVGVFRGLVRTPPEKRDPGAIAAARDGLSKVMGIMDDHLSRNDYMAGKSFTVGDIPLGIAAWRWFRMPIEREDYPHLKRWSDLLAKRKPYQTHVMQPLE